MASSTASGVKADLSIMRWAEYDHHQLSLRAPFPSFLHVDLYRDNMVSMWMSPLFVLAHTTTAIPLQNITLPLPAGTSNHGTPGLLCTPTRWTDIVLFFLFNYVAHAATVLTRPGERPVDSIVSIAACLLFPVLGLYRGIEAIFSGAIFVKKDDLRKAARSGALCMVVRGNDWRPVDGDEVGNAVFRRENTGANVASTAGGGTILKRDSIATIADESSLHVLVYSAPWINSKFGYPIYVNRQMIHGTCSLPEGYRLAIVPPDSQFAPSLVPNTAIEISASYNLVKVLIALIQSGYALWTLYKSQGDQIHQFGYAAFGLTVAPYAVMSVVNLLGHLCRPDYPSLYLVENSIMNEARRRGGVFEGSVCRVQEESTAVCGCGLRDGNDADELLFLADEKEGITASFKTTSPPACCEARNSLTSDLEKRHSSCVSLTPHSHPIKPLPETLNYVGTQDDALLLIPCCNPIKRSPTNDFATHYRLSKLTLRKVRVPRRAHSWFVAFAPNLSLGNARYWYLTKYLLTLIIAFTPLTINGALSHFQQGSINPKTSSTWRSYTMQGLILGVFSGIWWAIEQEINDATQCAESRCRPIIRMIQYFVSGSSAIGVFVVVGQMIARYGTCVWVGD